MKRMKTYDLLSKCGKMGTDVKSKWSLRFTIHASSVEAFPACRAWHIPSKRKKEFK